MGEVARTDWIEAACKPDIPAHEDRLYNKLGYDPL